MGKNSQDSSKLPPAGSFTTLAVLIEDKTGNRTRYTGTMESGNFLTGGDLIISVIAKDPYTGQAVRLENVKIETSIGTLVTGIPADGVFELSCPSYEMFCKRISTGMSAKPISKSPVVQNQSLPEQVKVRDGVDNFSNSPGTVCRQYNENAETAAKHLGLVHERDDLQILQGKQNGRSPGVVVSQGSGTVSMFSGDGKQNLNFTQGSGLEVNVASFNIGSAAQEVDTMQYGGTPQIYNPMTPMVPQGTIITPQPATLPNVQKVINFVATLADMIDLVTACSDAVKAVRSKDYEARQKAINKAKSDGTFVDAVTTSEAEK